MKIPLNSDTETKFHKNEENKKFLIGF